MFTIKLYHENFELYFPDADEDGRDLVHIKCELSNLMIRKFGGVTEIKARGFWDSEGEIFEDNLTIFKASSMAPMLWDDKKEILEFCFDYTKQKAFFYINNGRSAVAERD